MKFKKGDVLEVLKNGKVIDETVEITDVLENLKYAFIYYEGKKIYEKSIVHCYAIDDRPSVYRLKKKSFKYPKRLQHLVPKIN